MPGSLRLLCMHLASIRATDFWLLSPSVGLSDRASGRLDFEDLLSKVAVEAVCGLVIESQVLMELTCLVTAALCVPSPVETKKPESLAFGELRRRFVLGLDSKAKVAAIGPRPFGEQEGEDRPSSRWRGRSGNLANAGHPEKLLFRLSVMAISTSVACLC
mmetsp:Transcript_129102/g.306272  ORF Transcript_129102/g.306272 Transcript_129102/m.306272 type:complete len:160 (-) Transcript_129102:5-484(-)